jgi:hypothetical protein
MGMTRASICAVAGLCALSGLAAGGERRPIAREAEGMRPCPEMGAGFVRLPGSTTCVRISGRLAAEYSTSSRGAGNGLSGSGLSARANIDARTDTEYGSVRGVLSIRGARGAIRD